MISQVLYETIKFWLPLATAGGFLIKAFLAGKRGVSTWASQLLDNHMAHIQQAAEDASASLSAMTESNRQIAETMKEMRGDFQQSYTENARVQTAILTNLEVLKDRT